MNLIHAFSFEKKSHRRLDFIAPKEKFIEQLKNYFPDNNNDVDEYIELIKKVSKSSINYFSAKALPVLTEKVLSGYLRKNFLKFSRMTTYDGLRSITSNDKLIAVLAGQWGDYGMPPKESSFVMHCMIANHYFDGAS